jgi:hypothetical protein
VATFAGPRLVRRSPDGSLGNVKKQPVAGA